MRRSWRWPGAVLLAAGWAAFFAPSGVDLLGGRPISSGTAGLLVMLGGFAASVLGVWLLTRAPATPAPAEQDDPVALRGALRRQLLGLVLFHDGLLVLLAPPGVDLVLRGGGIQTGATATAVMSIGMLLGTVGTRFWFRHPRAGPAASKPLRKPRVMGGRPDDATGGGPSTPATGDPVSAMEPAGPAPAVLPVPAMGANESAAPAPLPAGPVGATGVLVPSRRVGHEGAAPGPPSASPGGATTVTAPGGPSVLAQASGTTAILPDPEVESMSTAASPPPKAVHAEPPPTNTPVQAGLLPAAGGLLGPAWSSPAAPESIEAAFRKTTEPSPEATAAELLAGLLAGTPEGSNDPAGPPAEGRRESGSSP